MGASGASSAASIGFGLVGASQATYLVGQIASGIVGLNTIVTLTSIAMAFAASYAVREGDRRMLAIVLMVFAAVQGVELLFTFAPGGFGVGFILFVLGLVVSATAAMRWRKAPAEEPTPRGLRWGAALAALAGGIYLVGNAVLGNAGFFALGATLALVGWTVVSMS